MASASTIINRTEPPRIDVVCLAAYTSGILHGRWVDATDDSWAIWDAIDAMLIGSPIAGAEELGHS